MDRRASRRASGSNGRAAGGSLHDDGDVDLDALAKPILTRRKDFIDKDEEARKSPNRVMYFRRNADYDRLIQACSRKLAGNPANLRALLIRASSHAKQGALLLCVCVQRGLGACGVTRRLRARASPTPPPP